MRRREFIRVLGGAAATWPLAARAQQPAMPVVIGFLSGTSREGCEAYLGALREGLRETGFVEGRNLTIEGRFADDRYDRLPALAGELIARRVALIAADPRGVHSAQALTKTIPIVFMTGADPVKNGMVTRLDHPGGNLTGVTLLATDLNAKRFELFHDLVSHTAPIGVLSDATNPNKAFILQDVQTAARSLGAAINVIEAGTESEIDAAFPAFVHEGAGSVFVNNGFLFFSLRARLIELAVRYRMPLSGEAREFATDGALTSYGPVITDAYRQVGLYAGRILKGEKPGDLPVQLPTKFELLINLKTAKALGLTVSNQMQLLADEVIE